MILGSELIEVESIKIVSYGKINLKFSNGTSKDVDLIKLLKSPPPVFLKLEDEAEFRKISINPVGGIQWECGADLSAEFLMKY
jgi:hypothetical protein